ncbi:UNVERIFIED_CONTAM: hypothetical protein Sindi_2149100 [Sesamum indicum]
MGDENSENRMAEGNWIQVGNATMLLQQNQDEGESLVSSAKPLKICDPICSTNRNPVDTDSAEQLLQELASLARLPRNQFRVNEIPEYLSTATGERPESPPPKVDPPLTAFDSLTELTRSTQSTQQFQQHASLIPTPILPKKSFAEVVAPPQASKTAKSAHHKYFPTDSPPVAFGTILTGDNGPTLQFTDAETEILAAPFRFALVGKFSHGAPSYSMLHKLIAGTGIKNRFTGYPMRVFKWTPTFTPSQESSIVPVWVSFPELPAHLFRKEVLLTVASIIGTPLQIDDATLNQSKLSKARACIELDLLKPRLEDFQIQICWATIVQRDAPKPPPRKQRKRAAVEVERGKAVVHEVGESSKTREQPKQLHPAKDTRYHAEHQTETMTSVNEFSVPADEVNIPCEAGKMGDLSADNLVVSSVKNIMETNLPNLVVGAVYPPIGGVEIQMRKKRVTLPQASKLFKNLKLFGMITPPLEEWDETDESDGEDDDVNLGSPRPVKIQNPACSLNSNPAEIEEREQYFASPTPPRKYRHRCTHWITTTT